MKSLNTPAIIYRLTRYSDNSAIALAFSPEYGKLKLFMPNAYSKKGGFMTLTPGNLTFIMKDTSDLHRFVAFSHNPAYHYYSQTPEIIVRLNICFDFFEHLFHSGEQCRIFWEMCLKYSEDNCRKAGLYTIYRLMKEAGVMFDLKCKCGSAQGDILLKDGELFCGKCGVSQSPEEGIPISGKMYSNLLAFPQNELFKNINFTHEEELKLLMLFNNHLSVVSGKNKMLKSVSVFISMQ
ncbi:MAG: recombination protein O N-terminal domain-containing protein [Deferribacteraceae bacterium]|jgi:DNA repair protein RecO (recombination protein O)|nr:recombination protein O N-terminal domain-containing protein [Deferribacteraceae bacterium]